MSKDEKTKGKELKIKTVKKTRKKKPKKVGYFGLAPIRRLSHDLGHSRISNEVLHLINRELEDYTRLILNACAESSKNFKRSTIKKADFSFAFLYVVDKPSRIQ